MPSICVTSRVQLIEEATRAACTSHIFPLATERCGGPDGPRETNCHMSLFSPSDNREIKRSGYVQTYDEFRVHPPTLVDNLPERSSVSKIRLDLSFRRHTTIPFNVTIKA